MRLACAFLASCLVLAFAASTSAAQYTITIKDMKFGPAPTHLKVGDVITWKNDDILLHTATAKTGAFDMKIMPGKQATSIVKRAGTIPVFCRYHPDMTLRLTVTK